MVESNISDATALSNPQPTGFGSQSDLTSINSTHAQHQVEILRMDMQNINRRLDVTTRERDDLQARVTDKQTVLILLYRRSMRGYSLLCFIKNGHNFYTVSR